MPEKKATRRLIKIPFKPRRERGGYVPVIRTRLFRAPAEEPLTGDVIVDYSQSRPVDVPISLTELTDSAELSLVTASRHDLRRLIRRHGKRERRHEKALAAADIVDDRPNPRDPPLFHFSSDQEILRQIKRGQMAPVEQLTRQIRQHRWGQDPAYKVSYCTTCYNRFWQLKQIVGINLRRVANDPDVEFVIVDFGGADSPQIAEWLTREHAAAIRSGRIRYFRRRQEDPVSGAPIPPFEWNVAIAKNVAHRFATGDIVVNLDGDNYLQPDDARIVRYYFNQVPNLVLQQTWSNLALINMMNNLGVPPSSLGVPVWHILKTNRGTYGRIALFRQDFFKLGGYNEQMLNMGNQDTDIIFRAIHQDYQYRVTAPQYQGTNSSIMNRCEIRKGEIRFNRHVTRQSFRKKAFIANLDGFRERLQDYEDYRQMLLEAPEQISVTS